MTPIESILEKNGIIPVIQIDYAKDAKPLAKALLSGGIDVMEITFRTNAAAEAIEQIRSAYPDAMPIAGTVLTLEQAKSAISSGAKAIVSPGTNPKIVSYCQQCNIEIFPGCATPTEIEAAMQLGLRTLKLFPAEAIGGKQLLSALYGPYPMIRFMPTGGISVDNAAGYLALPNVIACGGSWIATREDLLKQNFDHIQQKASETRKAVASIPKPLA